MRSFWQALTMVTASFLKKAHVSKTKFEGLIIFTIFWVACVSSSATRYSASVEREGWSDSYMGLAPTNPLSTDLAVAMGIDPANIVSATFSVDPIAGAVVTGTVGFLTPTEGTTFTMISSGNAQPIAFPNGWMGTPIDFLSVDNGNPGGTDPLGAFAYDIAILNLTLAAPSWAKSLSFDFRFMSEEYPEYVGSPYNDFFTANLNGVNIAFDTAGNIINVNNNFFDPTITPAGTVFDGATVLLTSKAPITGGTNFKLDFVVGDVGDSIYDTAVFLDNFNFSTEDIGEPITEPKLEDVATVRIVPSSTNVTLGQSVNINVTVENQGNVTETFIEDVFLSVYANTTFLGNQTVVSLAPNATRTLTFSWNTTGFLTGPYKITAIAEKAPGETDLYDNDLTFGMVHVQTGKMHTLSVYNSPALSTLLPFTINNTRSVSPWLGLLDEDTYIIAVPPTINDSGVLYNFKNWEDTTTNPTRIINLNTDIDIRAYYEVSSSSPLVYVSPIVIQALPDTTFTVNVTVANVTNLYTWECKLYYDTRFLDIVSATEGSFLKASGITTFWVRALNDAYNSTHGLAWLNCSLTWPPYGVNGSGQLAAITFTTTAIGNVILSLSETQLSNGTGTIPHDILTGVGLIRVRIVEDVNNDGVVDGQDAVLTIDAIPSYPGHKKWNPWANINQDKLVDGQDIILVIERIPFVDP